MESLHFPREREELLWYFNGLGASVGLKTAAAEYGGAVFDDAAQDRMHARMGARGSGDAHHRRRIDSEKARCIEATFRASWTEPTLRLAFTSFGAARASPRLQSTLAHEGVSLLALTLDSPRLLRHVPRASSASHADQIRFLERDVEKLPRGNRIPGNHRLHSVLDDAIGRCVRALQQYAKWRRKVGAEAKRIRDAESEASMVDAKTWLARLEKEMELCS